MNRYFLEVSYKGTGYAGFQVQKNAGTIQSEIEKAFEIYFRKSIVLTGSSRTDAGVHALQNFFHFDIEEAIEPGILYNINALLPASIVVKKLFAVKPDSHCRFDAVSREYKYYIYHRKDPFLADRAYFYPYRLNIEKMREASTLFLNYTDFASFSKRRTQVKTYTCGIEHSEWKNEDGCLVYHVIANRFLRGMIRGMVGTMLRLGRDKLTLDRLVEIIEARNPRLADFSAPAQGLFLLRVNFPDGYFQGGKEIE